eukprot:848721-Prorocentrum_minimum.AAC.2
MALPVTDGFTILRQDTAPGGLQVLTATQCYSLCYCQSGFGHSCLTHMLQVRMPEGSWVDVPPVKNSFIINAGDLIQV